MTTQHKSFDIIETKALDDEVGTFTALVSVFGNVDADGERVVPGAFQKSLEKWRESGDPIPVILSHDWQNPWAHVGVADPNDVSETERGLWVKGRLDIEDNDVARQVYKLMKRRSLKEFSFGFPRGAKRVRAKDGAYDLSDIDLVEFGPTLAGANPATELHAVKSALGVKDEPRDADTLRKEMERVQREVEEAQLPEVDETVPEQVKALRAMAEGGRAFIEHAPLGDAAPMKRLVDRLDGYIAKASDGKRLVSDVREQLDAAGAERFDAGENRWVYVDDFDPDQGWVVFHISGSDGERRFIRVAYTSDELGAVTLQGEDVEVVRATTYREKPAVEDTKDEDPLGGKSAVQDPLRKRCDELALEITSGGVSHRKSPPKAELPKPEAPPLGDLKRRSRDLMLDILSG